MDNAETVMRAMGEAIEKMNSNPDYKTRMEQEVALMHKERIEKYPGLGSWRAVKSYDEIFKLEAMLKAEGIPFKYHRQPDACGFQICYPEDGEKRVCSIILHAGSYGREQGLLEIMGLLKPDEEQFDDVVGYLTAEDVFERIKAHIPKKTWYEKIQEMSREEIATLLTRVYYSTLASAYMPRSTFESKKEAFLKALDEPYDEKEDET